MEVSLFASEPMLRNPTDMDIDERGRVWVCEGVNYRSTFQSWGVLRPEGDRIVILEDTNHDGIADKETTFYQGTNINAALGICVLSNRAIVACSPNVFLLTDTNNDGIADVQQVLFTGIGGVDHDHGVHAAVFGPDGKLYFNFGNEGKAIKRPDGTPVYDIEGLPVTTEGHPWRNGLIFRCNLDGSEFEVLAHNFRNNYETAVDSFGTLWQADNDDDGNKAVRLNYVMEHGSYGFSDELTGEAWALPRSNREEETPRRHWHQNDPGTVPNMLITGAGAPTGMLIYEGKLLPEIFRNRIILCDAGMRTVRAYAVQKDKAGYRADGIDLLTTSDPAFRPSDVTAAPDGSLYVCDWNDAVVGGHNMDDKNYANMTGRIYRIAPKGSKPSVPHYDFSSTKDAVAALQSPNDDVRYLAWTSLHEKQNSVESALRSLWHSGDQQMRARALQLLVRIKGRETEYLVEGVLDKNPDIRIAALRISIELGRDVLPILRVLAFDRDPQVRRECALALRHSAEPEAAKLWAQLATEYKGYDRWSLEALGIGADGSESRFFKAWLDRVNGQWNTPVGRNIIWRSRAVEASTYLARIINDPLTPESDRARYFRAFDFIPNSPEKEAALTSLLTTNTK